MKLYKVKCSDAPDNIFNKFESRFDSIYFFEPIVTARRPFNEMRVLKKFIENCKNFFKRREYDKALNELKNFNNESKKIHPLLGDWKKWNTPLGRWQRTYEILYKDMVKEFIALREEIEWYEHESHVSPFGNIDWE